MGYLTFDDGASFMRICQVGAMLRFNAIAGGVFF
jgi:hypothetical protein